MSKSKIIFITATDTGVGKTVAMFVLATLLRVQKYKVGVLKPVQCAGQDAQFLKNLLGLKDNLKIINPFYAPEPLSPHLAFRRSKINFEKRRVQSALKDICQYYEIVLVEGAGGLLVPLKNNYYNADLVADLKAEIVIVSRLGLGTINHTLLTINEAKRRKLKIRGVIFCQTNAKFKGIAEMTNPTEIEKLSGIKTLGIIPYLKPLNQKNVLRQCQNLILPV